MSLGSLTAVKKNINARGVNQPKIKLENTKKSVDHDNISTPHEYFQNSIIRTRFYRNTRQTLNI